MYSEHGLEYQVLPRGQRTDEQIVLLHIGTPGAQFRGSDRYPIDGSNCSGRDLNAGGRSIGQYIQKSRLAGPRTSHYRQNLSTLGEAIHILQQVFALHRRPIVTGGAGAECRDTRIDLLWGFSEYVDSLP